MKRIRIPKVYPILGISFMLVLGTVLHFVYAWSGRAWIVGLFSAINESPWEHLKLLFYPAILYTTLEYIGYGYAYDHFLLAKAFSILTAMLTMLALFYMYVGITGGNSLWVHISIFIVSVCVYFFVGGRFLRSRCLGRKDGRLFAVVVWALLFAAFLYLTVRPPHIPLFQDPHTGAYGGS